LYELGMIFDRSGDAPEFDTGFVVFSGSQRSSSRGARLVSGPDEGGGALLQ
jgi:hypothetical protein